MLSGDDKGNPILGDHAKNLLATKTGSNDERAVFLEAIHDSKALKPFKAFFDGAEFSGQQIANRIMAITGMSESTARRR